jgi:hypothetical protein
MPAHLAPAGAPGPWGREGQLPNHERRTAVPGSPGRGGRPVIKVIMHRSARSAADQYAGRRSARHSAGSRRVAECAYVDLSGTLSGGSHRHGVAAGRQPDTAMSPVSPAPLLSRRLGPATGTSFRARPSFGAGIALPPPVAWVRGVRAPAIDASCRSHGGPAVVVSLISPTWSITRRAARDTGGGCSLRPARMKPARSLRGRTWPAAPSYASAAATSSRRASREALTSTTSPAAR